MRIVARVLPNWILPSVGDEVDQGMPRRQRRMATQVRVFETKRDATPVGRIPLGCNTQSVATERGPGWGEARSRSDDLHGHEDAEVVGDEELNDFFLSIRQQRILT